MGDFNHLLWVKQNLNLIKSNVLEIGSKFYSDDTFVDYRKLCNDNNLNYVGVDLSEGRNVDISIDFTEDIFKIEAKLQRKFKTIICCSVLEHVKDIYKFANNVTEIVESEGILFISVPFVWEFHGYPDDYWRFTPASIEYLFNQFDFPHKYRTISSHIPYDMEQLIDDPNHFSYNSLLKGTSNPDSANEAFDFIRFIYNLFFRKKIFSDRLLYNSIGTTRFLKPCSINMIGFKNKRI